MLLCSRAPGCHKFEGHRSPCTVVVAPKPAVTAPDVRTAAQAEAEQHILVTNPEALRIVQQRQPVEDLLADMFVAGAVWGAALVTPTREQIAEVLRRDTRLCYPDGAPVDWGRCADAALALMQGLTKSETPR